MLQILISFQKPTTPETQTESESPRTSSLKPHRAKSKQASSNQDHDDQEPHENQTEAELDDEPEMSENHADE